MIDDYRAETQKKENEIQELNKRFFPIIVDLTPVHAFSRSQDAHLAVWPSICRLFIFCANTHSINGIIFYSIRKYLMLDVFQISMIQNVPSAQKEIILYELYNDNRMNGRNDKIYLEHIFEIRMINSVWWLAGLEREL